MTGSGKPRQFALDLGHTVARSRDDLLVTPANAEAVAMVDRWPDWPSPFLVIAGPPGSGRSHLGQAWRERADALALAPDDLTASGLQDVARPILIDDADAVPLDETGLFHLLNAAVAKKSSALMTARTPPSLWPVRLPDLASRLKLAAVTALGSPDDALLAGVVTKLFADRQVEIEPHVLQFFLRRVERSLAAAARAADALDRAAMERKVRLTRALVAEVMAREEGFSLDAEPEDRSGA